MFPYDAIGKTWVGQFPVGPTMSLANPTGSTTQPFTILWSDFRMYQSPGLTAYMSCTDPRTNTTVTFQYLRGATVDDRTYLKQPCASNITLTGMQATYDINIIYVPYNVFTATTSPQFSVVDRNLIFGIGIIIVILFLMVIGFVFNHINKNK